MSDAQSKTTPAIHPDTADRATLVDRLRGIYRIPIRDGLGATGGGEEPDNPSEHVTHYQTPPIQRVAAAEIERLRAALREIASGTYPVPLNEDVEAWRSLAARRKDIAQKALDHAT